MRHPLHFLSSKVSKRLFWTFLAGTLVLFAVFRVLDAPLRTPAAPNGIVSFELAGNIESTAGILLSWDERADLYAAFGLGIDYLFMPLYATALALGILLAASKHGGWFFTLGAWLGWGAYAAMLFDALENYALARMLLLNEVWSPYPQVAAFSASIKFGLLSLGLFFALAGWLWPKK
jgi:hypothetical protein